MFCNKTIELPEGSQEHQMYRLNTVSSNKFQILNLDEEW